MTMDDDDIYPSTRVSHAVNQLMESPCLVAGCTILFVLDVDTEDFYMFGPYHKNHATNATFAYKKEFLVDHKYDDENKESGEERYFLNNYKEPMVQLNPQQTILCLNHGKNTVDKKKLFYSAKKLDVSLDNSIRDPHMRGFVRSLKQC